jgi:hypothetical protein
MNHSVIRAFTIFACFASFGARQALAETFYVAQSAGGNGSGTDAGNPKAISFFNSSANWSSPSKASGKIGPGDIVHLVGTISTPLSVQASGVSGNPITVLFDSGAKLSAPAWPASGALVVDQKDYITVDGASTGIIECTANGTNLANHVDSAGVAGNSASYLTVKNLTIRNMYVRTAGTEQYGYGTAIQNPSGGSVSGHTGFTVTNCTISDAYIGVQCNYGPAGVTNMAISYCSFTHCNWGSSCGDRGAAGSKADGIVFHHNNFTDCSNWDDTVNNSFHHNGFYGWAESGGTFRNFTGYANNIGPTWGGHTTAGMFFSGDVGGILIYNNVFLESGSNDAPSNGLIMIWPHDGSGTGFRVFNNTFKGDGNGRGINLYNGNGASSTVFEIKNNIFYGMGTAIAQFFNGSARLVSDNNCYYGLTAGQEFSTSSNGSAGYLTLTQWKSLGLDLSSIMTNPNIDGAFRLLSSSTSVLGLGVNLSSYFTVDKDGKARATIGSWDLGAYVGGGVASVVGPSNAVTAIVIK